MILIRSLAAVLLGYGVMAGGIIALFAIWFQEPTTVPSQGFMYFSLIYGGVWAGLGGWITAEIAPHSPQAHTFGLMGLVAVMGLISMVTAAGQEALWYQLANLIIALGVIRLVAYLQFQWSKKEL